jgi:hypothetical protein
VNVGIATLERYVDFDLTGSFLTDVDDANEFGILSNNVSAAPILDLTGIERTAVQDSLIFTLRLSGLLPDNLISQINDGYVVAVFGNTPNAVPEPSSLLLLGIALAVGLVWFRSREFAGAEPLTRSACA